MSGRRLGRTSSSLLTDRALRRIGLCALAVILAARAVLIVDALGSEEPVSTAFDEDAYFGFAVARNVAAGNGIAAGHGEPTNGFQPLWTFLLVPAFALGGCDRAILASIYLLSVLLWLAAARLLAALVVRRVDSDTRLGWAALPCLAMVAGDARLAGYFFNGLETGCYAVGLLLFWRWLDADRPLDGRGSWLQSLAFGLCLGALLLVRNDAVLFAPFLLLAGARRDARALPHLVLAAAVAAAVFSPWLAYNYSLSGHIQPQSGVSTMIRTGTSALDWSRAAAAIRAVIEQTAPPLLPGITRLPSWCLAAFAVVLCAGFTRLWRRDPQARETARSAAWLAAGAVVLVIYYALFSRATWMYPRYFLAIRLLSIAAWSHLLFAVLHAWAPWRSTIAALLLLAAAAIGTVHAFGQLGSSGKQQGPELRLLIASGFCDGPARVGMLDSGRTGYRCAPYVVNLDGKGSLESLNAVTQHRLLERVAAAQIDRLLIRDDHLPWFDSLYPQWRRQFSPAGHGENCLLFTRAATAAKDSTTEH